ncbi:MAG: argininosuccinate lyase [Nitrospirae bacterium]|nr:argininosuccinate lyase [Nitrospirota bacterium]
MKKPWDGRFTENTEKTVEAFTSSVSFDRRLWKYDIQGSAAHVRMLKKQKIIPARDAELILRGLGEIAREIGEGKFKFREDLEDVHMNIEYALINRIGPAGGKLHTARSRNDQVALDIRLFLREEISGMIKLTRDLQRVFLALADRYKGVVMPGYTHLQRAQPVMLSHHLLAYFEMLERDRGRFGDCAARVNVLPLGSCALAGTSLPIDRKYVARLLGFAAVSENSIDAVSDRDFIIEFLSAASVLMLHLSRLSEELVLWSTEEFGFISLPDAYSTGSSIMPQKKNPDVPELVRGKAGRVCGNLMAMLVVLKGLPLAYNRDLQEDKEPLFDTVDTVKDSLSVLTKMMPKIKFNKTVMLKAAEGGFSTATDLAEYLAKKGLPFREAHNVTGRIVKYCIHKKKLLEDLTMDELKKYSGIFEKDVFDHLSITASVNRKTSLGGTAGKRVLQRIKDIKSTI